MESDWWYRRQHGRGLRAPSVKAMNTLSLCEVTDSSKVTKVPRERMLLACGRQLELRILP